MRLRILLSFHYYRGADIDRLLSEFAEPPEVFADSGAYSAESLGAEVSVEDYCAWLHRWEGRFSAYANLDVIGNDKATWDNQRAMESLGTHPLPVFHGGEDWDYLQRYVEQYPYMCLGGMAGGAARSDHDLILRFCIKAFQIARATGTIYHGFGMTRVGTLRALPWYSVDSSSWGGAHRYGQVTMWDEKRARFVGAGFGDHSTVYANAALIRAHGGDPKLLATKGFCLSAGKPPEQYRAERRMAIGINVTAWLRMEQSLRKWHGEVGPPANHAQHGPKVYLAAGNTLKPAGTEDTEGLPYSHLAEASFGPKVYLADSRAERTVNYLADVSHDGVGPKVYLADGSWGNFAADASAVQED